MTLAIVTDSNASLPPDLVRDLPLYVVPMQIRHGEQVYRDGLDITPDAFYALQAGSATPLTTSGPEPGAFVDALHRAADRADEVVCLALSSRLSATYSSALAAADGARGYLGSTRVEVVDTQSAATAQGLMVLAAARAAAKGANADDILGLVPSWTSSVELFGYLGSLDYLWRSGRVPRLLTWMGKALGVRPVLRLTGGRIGMVERPRSEHRAMARVALLAQRSATGARVRVAVMHAAAPERAAELAQRLQEAIAPVELFVTELTPVIGAHTGPGLVGCAVHRLEPDEA